jgi:hypothetical protein
LLFWLTNSHGAEVKELLNLHRIVKCDVECLSIEDDILLVLFDVVSFDVFNVELNLLYKFLFNFGVKFNVNLDILTRLEHTLCR